MISGAITYSSAIAIMQEMVQYKKEMEQELRNILAWWMNYMPDEKNGGFYGAVNNENIADEKAAKGVVLNARILWAFSAANQATGNEGYLAVAELAFHYILDHFDDKKFDGVYWSVDAKGNMLDGKKQVYGLAFCIYGMSAYYAATKDQNALNYAIELYQLIEKYSYDTENKGYLEAFSREWKQVCDQRLSDKDANAAKTMNTHLHIVEAYANLYKVWKDDELKKRIVELLQLFDEYFIDKDTFHLKLFFDEQWNEKPDVISYGHDIEAAWLLLQCAEIVEDAELIAVFEKYGIAITDAAAKGISKDYGLWYEYDPATKHLVFEKHSWPQAEAMIGFFNAFQLTGNEKYLKMSTDSWAFVKEHLLDKTQGEWFWGVNEDYDRMQKEKAGFWKCPYHNSRACMEIIKRIDAMQH